MNKLDIFPGWRVLLNVNETKKAIYATLHANSKFLKEASHILNWFASNQTATLDQEINAKSSLEKLFRTKYSTNPWKVSTIGREKFENDVTELKKCLPPTIQLQYDSNEIYPTLYIRIETSSENHIYPRQTVRFYIPVSDSYPRERPFVYCEPPIYHPFINQATGVVSLEDIEKHSHYIQNRVINNDSYVIRSLNSSLNVSGSTTPVTSPSKLSNSTSSIVNNTNSNGNALSVEKIERLTASLEIAAKSPISDEMTSNENENNTNKTNFEYKIQPVPISSVEYPPITVTTTNTNQITPNTPSTPVSSSPHTPSTPSSSNSSTSTSSNFSSPFCSPYRSEGQNVLKAVVDALQNLFVDTSYLTNYMNF